MTIDRLITLPPRCTFLGSPGSLFLNLANSQESDIEYTLSKFPDGQQSIRIDTSSMYWSEHEVLILSRMNSFLDLEMIVASTQALRELGVKSISLSIPYFLGGRSDRKFETGGVNYIKSVISPIINLQGYNEVYVIDPHSDVIEACINNIKKINNTFLVEKALKDWESIENRNKNIVLVSSDAGALKKIYGLVESLSNGASTYPIIIGNKHRNKEGKITHTSVPDCEKYTNHDYFIVDDICDGGRTFIEVAKVIKNEIDKVNGTGRIYLVVTHGIFSSGLLEISKYFDKVWTTNSISDIKSDLINQSNLF